MSSSQSATSPLSDENVAHCRMCETAIPEAAQKCPRCGMPIRQPISDPTEVRTEDVVLSVIMAVMAIFGTVPMTYPVLRALATTGTTSALGAEIVVVGIWNGIILGIPIVLLVRRWFVRIRKGNFDHAWIWRDYWFLQAMALSPIWFCLGYMILARDADWFWALLRR